MTAMTLTVNGQTYPIDVDPATPLLWVLRDVIGLTGTKYGCGVEICRACAVWIDGSAEKSCDVAVKEVVGKKITTIEGLSATKAAKIQQAFVDVQAPQCGYCQSGMLMYAAKLVQDKAKPTDADIDAALKNICACGTYPRVKLAIKRATGQ